MNLPHVQIITFGCQMNVCDSERMAEILQAAGYTVSLGGEDDAVGSADVLIVNTCSVRAKAEQKALSLIGTYAKQENPPLIVMAGCMAQVHQRELLGKVTAVSHFVGPNDYYRLPELLGGSLKGRKVWTNEPQCGEAHDFIPAACSHTGPSAFVTVMKGCDNFCAYCVVPYARGPERSRPAQDIYDEVKRLTEQGVQEVSLLGQNVNSYKGSGSVATFADLLRYVAEVPGLKRLRFMTSHPKDLSADIVKAIADVPNICKALHLPVQAGSNKVLKAMGRGYTREHYLDLLQMIRSYVPDIALTTDILVGFPGESESDFLETASLVELADYTDLFVFAYSPRPHTKAAELVDDVPQKEKVARLTKIVEIQNIHSQKHMEKLLGKELKVLVEGPSKSDKSLITGRTEGNKLVHFSADVKPGSLVTVKITAIGTHSLRGELCHG